MAKIDQRLKFYKHIKGIVDKEIIKVRKKYARKKHIKKVIFDLGPSRHVRFLMDMSDSVELIKIIYLDGRSLVGALYELEQRAKKTEAKKKPAKVHATKDGKGTLGRFHLNKK